VKSAGGKTLVQGRGVGGDFAKGPGRDAFGVPFSPFCADGVFSPPGSHEHLATPKERIEKPKPGVDSNDGSPASDSGNWAMALGSASRSGTPAPAASRPATPAGLREFVASFLSALLGLKPSGVSGASAYVAQPASVVIQVGNQEQQGASAKAPAARPAKTQSRGWCPKRLSLPKPTSAGGGPALLRALAVAVGLSEVRPHAFSTVLRAGANATLVVTDAALQVIRATVGVVELARHGFEADRVTANVTVSRRFQAPHLQLLQWKATPIGEELDRVPGRRKQRFLASLYAASPALPLFRGAARLFDSVGLYVEAEFEAQLFGSGHVGVRRYHGAVILSARWANPGWVARGQPVSSEWKALATVVHGALEGSARVPRRKQDLPEPPGLGLPPVPSQWSWAALMQQWRLTLFQIASGDGDDDFDQWSTEEFDDLGRDQNISS